MIGDYAQPGVRLPGSGGAPEIATSCQRTYIVMAQTPRSFVGSLDFVSSLGYGRTGREREACGVRTAGPVLLVTDLCLMQPNPGTHEFEVVSLHPGVSRDRVRAGTGWPVAFASDLRGTPPPTRDEIETLRDLHARTAHAHGIPPHR